MCERRVGGALAAATIADQQPAARPPACAHSHSRGVTAACCSAAAPLLPVPLPLTAAAALSAAAALAALAASALRMASRSPSTMKRLVRVSRNSALPWRTSTLASAVPYTTLAAAGGSHEGGERGMRAAPVREAMATLQTRNCGSPSSLRALTENASRDGGKHKGEQEVEAKERERRRLL